MPLWLLAPHSPAVAPLHPTVPMWLLVPYSPAVAPLHLRLRLCTSSQVPANVSYSLALSNTGLLLAGFPSGVTAFSATSGQVAWSVPSSASPPSGPPCVYASSLYLASPSGVLALAVGTGASQWMVTVNATTGASATPDGSLVVVGAGSVVTAVHSTNGSIAWTCAVNASILSSLVISAGPNSTLFVVTTSGLSAVDWRSGVALWSFTSPETPSPAGYPAAIALGWGGLVYFSTAGCVLAIDPSSPAAGPVWLYNLRAPLPALTIAAGDVLLFGTVDVMLTKAYVTALAGTTGYFLWSAAVANDTQLGGIVVGPGQEVIAAAGGALIGLQGGVDGGV